MARKKREKKQKKQKKEQVYQLSLLDKRRGGQPGNTNAVKHGLYSPRFAPDEVAGLTGMRDGLAEEIDLTRVLIARLLDYEQKLADREEVKIEDQMSVYNLMIKSSQTVARLMQVNKALSDAQNVSLGSQLLEALQEVTGEIINNG